MEAKLIDSLMAKSLVIVNECYLTIKRFLDIVGNNIVDNIVCPGRRG